MTKTVVIIGATGGCGKHALEDALKRGCKVFALVRSPNKIEQPETESFQKIQVDVCNHDSLMAAMPDEPVDAIISCLGRPGGKIDSMVVSEGTKNIVEVMTNETKKQYYESARLLIITSWGMGEGEGETWTEMKNTWMGWMFQIVFLTMLRKVRTDLNLAEKYVKESTLKDYVLVRPGGLTDDPPTGNIQEALPGEPLESFSISRADVGHFMVREAVEPSEKWRKAGVTLMGKSS